MPLEAWEGGWAAGGRAAGSHCPSASPGARVRDGLLQRPQGPATTCALSVLATSLPKDARRSIRRVQRVLGAGLGSGDSRHQDGRSEAAP